MDDYAREDPAESFICRSESRFRSAIRTFQPQRYGTSNARPFAQTLTTGSDDVVKDRASRAVS